MKENEATAHAILENMPAGCFWCDETGRLEYVNRSFVDLFGYTLESIPTIPAWLEHVIPDPNCRGIRHDLLWAHLSDARSNGVPATMHADNFTCKDGTVRLAGVTFVSIGSGVLAVFNDITDREYIQNELRKAQKLESLGVQTGGFAHDLKIIMTAVIGHISYAQTSFDNPDKARESLEIAINASRNAVEIARRLIAFTKSDEPIKKVVAVRRLVVESLLLALPRAYVEVSVHIPDTIHDIEVDAGQISRVFNNIVINAVQSMPNGGTFTVHSENATWEECGTLGLSSGTYIRISFTDEGCGISEEDQERIFEPYFTTKTGGTGLGMASAHSIIKKHGGQIFVSSQAGAGTTFTIFLPSTGTVSSRGQTSGSKR